MRKTKRVGSRVSVANSRNCARTAHRRFCLLDLLEARSPTRRPHAGITDSIPYWIATIVWVIVWIRDLGDPYAGRWIRVTHPRQCRENQTLGDVWWPSDTSRPADRRQKPPDSQSSERRLVGRLAVLSLYAPGKLPKPANYERACPVTGGNVRVAACSDGRRRRVATACSSARSALRPRRSPRWHGSPN